MRLVHSLEAVSHLREPTVAQPWRVLLSGCLFGWGCGVDGSSYGMEEAGPAWLRSSKIALHPFCPEQEGLGTPRTMPDLHGGDGFAVLDGRARVLDEHGRDLTEKMLTGAEAMLRFALSETVDFALLTDMSGACGSQVISLGCRFDEPRRCQLGVGVATALLLRAHIPVVSQRDFRTLAALHRRIDPSAPAETRPDHHEHPWVLENLRGRR